MRSPYLALYRGGLHGDCSYSSDSGGSDIPPPGQSTEKDRALDPIMDYALAVKRLDAARACNSLTKGGQQRLVHNFGSTATDCEKVLKREFSSLSGRQKRELAKRLKTVNIGEGKVEGGYGNGEVIYVQGTETQFVPVKVQSGPVEGLRSRRRHSDTRVAANECGHCGRVRRRGGFVGLGPAPAVSSVVHLRSRSGSKASPRVTVSHISAAKCSEVVPRSGRLDLNQRPLGPQQAPSLCR